MENKISKNKAFLAALISSAITGAVVLGLCNKHFSDLKEKESTIKEFFEVKDYIDEFFYDDINDETLITSALKGLVSGLDDNYAAYMTPEEYEQSIINVQGSLTGIGISVTQNDEKKVEIVDVTENSPASKYDIQSGDILTAIDGIDAENIEYNNLVNLVRGKEGTNVTITLDRNGKKLEYTITREKIETQTVTYEMLENNIAYIKITDEASIKKYGGDNMYFAPPIYFITYTTIETLFRIIKRMIKVIILNNKYGKIIGN